MIEPLLQPCDITVHYLPDDEIAKIIRWRTKGRKEGPTIAHHVGIVVEPGLAPYATVIEALVTERIRPHRLGDYYAGSDTRIAVYRPLNLTPMDKEIIVAKARSYEGRKYGFGKIALQLVGVRGFVDKWPICSWVVAHAYGEAGYYFGRPPMKATPDDIHDFAAGRADRFDMVRPFAVMEG